MAEGTLTVGVEVDAQNALDGFAEAVLAEVLPALEQVRREMDDKLGQGGKSRWSAMGDVAGGSFIGSFAANIATKGLALVQSAISKIGDMIGNILSKGWDRLVTIDTAKTKMAALKLSAQDTANAMNNALQAVKGTAFGLGDAATVAASALAAGVKPGESLVKYLRLVADTAAVARKQGQGMGDAFNSMGSVINNITTQGYATMEQLGPLVAAGLPIIENLAKKLNMSGGEVMELASKSGIAASTVRAALVDTVGGAALKMGESFEGGSENAQAALARLGEALLKPFFEPAKEGVFNLTSAIDDLTKMVVANGPEITRVIETLAILFIDVSAGVIKAIGDIVIGAGELVEAIGDIWGGLLKFQAWMSEYILGDKEFAEQMKKDSEAAYGWGESITAAGEKMKGVNPEPLKNKIHDLANTIANGQQINLDYAASQAELTKEIERGLGPMKYQAQMMEWINKVRAFAANPTTAPPPGIMPSYVDASAAVRPENVPWYVPTPANAGTGAAAAGGAGAMPADIAKTDKDKKPGKDDTPWLKPGDALPSVADILAAGGASGAAAADAAATDLPDAVKDLSQTATQDLPQAATDLSKSAADLTAAAAATPSYNLSAYGGSTARLNDSQGAGVTSQPSVQVAAAAVMGLFGDQIRGDIGGSRSYNSAPNTHEVGLAMDIPIGPDQKPLGDAIRAYLQANAEAMNIRYTIWRDELINTVGGAAQYVGGHQDHIDVQFNNGAPGMPTGMPGMPTGAFMPNMPPIPSYGGGGGGSTGGADALGPGKSYGTPINVPGLGTVVPINEVDYSALGLAPGTYQIPSGVTAPDPAKIAAQEEAIKGLHTDLLIKEQQMREMRADAAESQKLAAADAYETLEKKIAAEETKLEALKRGETGKPQTITVGQPTKAKIPSIEDMVAGIPYGDPRRFMIGAMSGIGFTGEDIGRLVGPMIGSVGGPLGGAVGSVAGAIAGMPLPGPMGYPGAPTAPSTDLNQLLKEQNPLLLAQMAGVNVPDYSRAGGGPQDINQQGGPASDALGRIYSDTAALVDRTFTSLDAAEKARHDQVMSVLNEVRDRLAKDYVEPLTTAAVTNGINGMGQGTTDAIGKAIGDAAAPQIASAVATPSPNILQGGNYASGGPIFGAGTGVSDSILARVSHGEYVLPASDVSRMGGFRAVDQFRSTLWGGLPRFATGGGVDVSSTVGAELFGMGQVPILSTIINLLVGVLLKVIGVQIEARDTLNEIGSDFRDFRGDFKAFDAAGRLMNDTSGLLDRSGSTEQAVVDERVRILKLVLEGILKWLIEKIIVPIGKAVANTAIQIGAQAVNGAITGGVAMAGGGPAGAMLGSMASGAITAAGSATVDILAEVGTIFAESILSIAIDSVGQLFQSSMPGLMSAMFSGKGSASIWDKLTMTNSGTGGMFAGAAGAFAGLAGGLASLFDEGGVARGTGLMPKGTIHPERVLSPRQTASFDRLVNSLASGRSANTTTIHAPFTVIGSERGGREARDRLLALMS